MIPHLFLAAVLMLSQSGQGKPAAIRFAKPSEAFAYANAPMAEWEAAVKARQRPKTNIAPQAEVRRRANALCPSFAVESVSGEELYWLANLCQYQSLPATGLRAVSLYLAGSWLEHRPEAHLLLSALQVWTTGSWESSWGTFRTILQEDPFGSDQDVRLRVAIEEEADEDEAKALQWAEERYSLLLERLRVFKPLVPPISPDWVVMAGADLTHRYYLAGKKDQAAAILAEINRLQDANPVEVRGWSSDHLNWANMETKPAPPIPVLQALGSNPGADIVQPGRVELVSFFFLRCSPCLYELQNLNDFQKRFAKDKVLVVDITTYKAALQPDAPPHKEVDSAIEKIRRKKSRRLTMVVAPEQTLQDYGINSFPAVAVIDKSGHLRYAGHSINYDSGEELDRLVRRLLDEQVQP
jgi:thiol-disulfide isomerase/thioredoxin